MSQKAKHWSVPRIRTMIRRQLFDVVAKVVDTDDWRDHVARSLHAHNLMERPPELTLPLPAPTYPDLPRRTDRPSRRDVVFVTGRFRSGSTLVWNLFRQVPAITAYYEPFNERRWFDPKVRGSHVDPTHVNVTDYWREYEGLTELADCFREEWKFRNLYMDARSYDPGMRRYIDILIERAPGRPLLQFNEVDFRLSWLRTQYPEAKLVHIYRHPRAQWKSTLGRNGVDHPNLTIREFEPHDGFYLLRWARDLRRYFPVLDVAPHTHPYKLFYQIWRLSHAFGAAHADYSFSLEEIVAAPREPVRRLMNAAGIKDYDEARLLSVLNNKTSQGRAPLEKHLEAAEQAAEDEFVSYLGPSREPGGADRKASSHDRVPRGGVRAAAAS